MIINVAEKSLVALLLQKLGTPFVGQIDVDLAQVQAEVDHAKVQHPEENASDILGRAYARVIHRKLKSQPKPAAPVAEKPREVQAPAPLEIPSIVKAWGAAVVGLLLVLVLLSASAHCQVDGVRIQNGGTTVKQWMGGIASINFSSGCTYDAVNFRVNCSAGSTSPGGSNTQVEWNNNGSFGGITNLLTDGTNVTGERHSSSSSIDWDSGAGAVDLSLVRDAANILAIKNAGNSQTLRVYGTTTGPKYLMFSADGVNGNHKISAAGSGPSSLWFNANGADRWVINSSGHFIAAADNSFDIGASGASRPRSIYWGTQLLGPDGTSNSPSLAFASQTSTGLYKLATSWLAVSLGTNAVAAFSPVSSAGLNFGSTYYLTWSNGAVGAGQDTGIYRSSAGVVAIGKGGSSTDATGGLLHARVVTAKTANYTVVANDSNTFFTNTGAAGSVNFTLPTAAAGLTYTFYIDAAQTLQITAGASTTIRSGASVTSAAGNVSASTQGNVIRIVAISSTQWVAESIIGTWTFV